MFPEKTPLRIAKKCFPYYFNKIEFEIILQSLQYGRTIAMSGIFKAYDIRGVYPADINADIAEAIGRAYIEFTGAKKVVVGRDMRPHSQPLFEGLSRGMLAQGADVIDLGLCSTPMSYFANGTLKADGSVMITASHNPGEWNGFKLCRANAVPISGATGIMDIQKIAEAKSWKKCDRPGKLSSYDIAPEYGKFLRSFAKMDRKLKVVVDYANAMGLYEIAGITDLFDIVPLYDTLDGTFPNHEANPLHLATLDAIRAKVKEVGADFGAAFDGDADRCGFIDDRGEIIPMDLFTALIAQDILSNGPATILYDLRSSPGGAGVHPRKRRQGDPVAGRPRLHQGADARKRRGLRGRAFRPLLLQAELHRRIAGAGDDHALQPDLQEEQAAARAGPAAAQIFLVGRNQLDRRGREADSGCDPQKIRGRQHV